MPSRHGIDATHLDAHMGTAQMPEFTAIFRRLGHDYRLPVLLVKDLTRYNPASYAGPLDYARYDARSPRRARPGAGVRDRPRDPLGAEDRRRDRVSRDLR